MNDHWQQSDVDPNFHVQVWRGQLEIKGEWRTTRGGRHVRPSQHDATELARLFCPHVELDSIGRDGFHWERRHVPHAAIYRYRACAECLAVTAPDLI